MKSGNEPIRSGFGEMVFHEHMAFHTVVARIIGTVPRAACLELGIKKGFGVEHGLKLAKLCSGLIEVFDMEPSVSSMDAKTLEWSQGSLAMSERTTEGNLMETGLCSGGPDRPELLSEEPRFLKFEPLKT